MHFPLKDLFLLLPPLLLFSLNPKLWIWTLCTAQGWTQLVQGTGFIRATRDLLLFPQARAWKLGQRCLSEDPLLPQHVVLLPDSKLLLSRVDSSNLDRDREEITADINIQIITLRRGKNWRWGLTQLTKITAFPFPTGTWWQMWLSSRGLQQSETVAWKQLF